MFDLPYLEDVQSPTRDIYLILCCSDTSDESADSVPILNMPYSSPAYLVQRVSRPETCLSSLIGSCEVLLDGVSP